MSTMNAWLLGFAILYLGLMATLAWRSRKRKGGLDAFLLGDSKLGVVIGFLTTAATLFSTFTLMGMPDFFRNHGVGAWIFLAVSDGAMVFGLVWFAYYLRKKVAQKGFRGVGGLLADCYGTRVAGILYFGGVFIFLIPYVAIQISGIDIFLQAIFPGALPFWAWGLMIVGLMLLYSETGGLKAIVFADVVQGVLLLTVVWIMAASCVAKMGGIEGMFAKVEAQNAALLSTPGPELPSGTGLFTPQFLIAAFLSILFVPITQPQITTRIVIMKDMRSAHRMAIGVGIFAMLVILPTLPIGFYGAVTYPGMETEEFLPKALMFDQPAFIAAAGMIGLLAAAISTSDSQIFALGGELRSLISGEEAQIARITKWAIVGFALAALLFALFSGKQLVLLAQRGFSGTALLGPMILAAVLSKRPPGKYLLGLTALALVLFLGSEFELMGLTKTWGPIRPDWFLLACLGLAALLPPLVAKLSGTRTSA